MIDQDIISVLQGVLKDLKDGNWTQGAPARNSNNEAIEPSSPDAVCWCISGSIAKHCAGLEDYYTPNYLVRRFISKAIKSDFNHKQEYSSSLIFLYNDAAGRTIEDCIEVVNKALSLAYKSTDPDQFFK
jgi:hypothetical protein